MYALRVRFAMALWRVMLVGLGVSATILVVGIRPSWGIGGFICLSNDDHVYFILRGNVAAEGTQVTSVQLSTGCGSACAEAGSGNQVVTALAAGVRGSGASVTLLPNRMRTNIIAGVLDSGVSCADFDPLANGGAGELDLPGTNNNCISVALSSGAACQNGVGRTALPLFDIHTAGPGIPAGVDLTGQTRTIPGPASCSGDTTAFPNGQGSPCSGSVESDPTFGEVPCQTITFDDRLGSPVGNISAPGVGTGTCLGDCSVAPTQTAPDGFLLKGDCSADATCQALVFTAARDPSASFFSTTAAGFKVDAAGVVFGTDSFATNNPCPEGPQPSITPTATATPTVTLTPTLSPTPTATNVPTSTLTPEPTNTPPPVPVAPSPTSPAGVLLVAAMGVSIVWALGRMARLRSQSE